MINFSVFQIICVVVEEVGMFPFSDDERTQRTMQCVKPNAHSELDPQPDMYLLSHNFALLNKGLPNLQAFLRVHNEE